MSTELISSRIADMIASLAPKAKQPNSSTVLNAWIAQAETKAGLPLDHRGVHHGTNVVDAAEIQATPAVHPISK